MNGVIEGIARAPQHTRMEAFVVETRPEVVPALVARVNRRLVSKRTSLVQHPFPRRARSQSIATVRPVQVRVPIRDT